MQIDVPSDEEHLDLSQDSERPSSPVQSEPTTSSSRRSSVAVSHMDIPTVHIEMAGPPTPRVDEHRPPTPPIDTSLLSPPEHKRFVSRPRRHSSVDVPIQRRPVSAPPVTILFESQIPGNSVAEEQPPRRHSVYCERGPVVPLAKAGDLVRPPPPLFRPTTFWRNTRRSGVTGPAYSPSSHLIRRSTFIAAGLTLDKPIADLSAFGVESRIGFLVLPSDTSI
ncbi:hypothetical protein K474DRAFT_1712523 [Panus rudis PR-1116 ss-1]|nr:hypothetical protein K474DRAFT_1712523 [Panus rudis PR-1116 ss-1]